MIKLETVKTLLNITTTDYDAQLTLLMPMVENDVRRILNNQFNERVDCEFELGSTTISNLWNLRSSQTGRYFQYTSSKLTNPVEIGRVLEHPSIPEETYITAYDEENGIATISQATTGDGDYVISSINYGMFIPIAKMAGFKLNGMSRQVCDGELASKSMGPVSVSYVQHIDKRWGYPMDILRDLGTPIPEGRLMLECFSDWPRQTIEIFQHTATYDPNTGVETEGYSLRESRDVFIFQKSAIQTVFAESIVDQLALIVVTDEAIDNTDLIKHAGLWYSVAYPDDILGMGEVTTIGLVKIKAPASVTGEAPTVDMLGDSGGLV